MRVLSASLLWLPPSISSSQCICSRTFGHAGLQHTIHACAQFVLTAQLFSTTSCSTFQTDKKRVSAAYQVKSPFLKLHPFTFFSWLQHMATIEAESPTNGAFSTPGTFKGCRGNSPGTNRACTCTLTHACTDRWRLFLAAQCSRPHANGAPARFTGCGAPAHLRVKQGPVNQGASLLLFLWPTFRKELDGTADLTPGLAGRCTTSDFVFKV